MTESIVFRILKPNELELYHQIRLESLRLFPNHFRTMHEEEVLMPFFKFDDVIKNGKANAFMMGAFIQKELIGLCGFIQENRLQTCHNGEISQMYIQLKYQGKGIGYLLLENTIQKAFELKDLRQINLSVAESNKAANKLYLKVGFKPYGKLPDYFNIDGRYDAKILMYFTR